MTTWHKPEISEADANAAVQLLLDIIFSSQHCTASRMRWGDVLCKLLRALRNTITLVIPWRSLHQAMRACSDSPAQAYSGSRPS